MEMFETIRKHKGVKDWGGRLYYMDHYYYFQPLEFIKMQGGRWYYNEPFARKDFENLEVVARGIIAQYIHYSDEQTVKEIFTKYYSKCFAIYKDNKNKQHDIEIMLKPDDEIEAIFVQAMVEDEAIRIKSSMEKLEKYLTEDEFSVMQKVGENFMAHLRSRLQELKPKSTVNPSAKEFLAVFNALSRDCLMYIENKYDLGYKENPNSKTVLSPDMQHKIFEVLPGQIASGFDEGVITLANLNKVIEEIETNIDNCKTQPKLERYVVGLLEPFRAISGYWSIFQHENFEKQRAKIEEEMAKLGTPENCLNDLLYIMTKYANKLYAVLIQRGFDLAKFQDDVEVYLKKNWTWLDIAPYVGGKKRAQRFIEQLDTPPETPSDNTYILNDKILNALPDLYDSLIDEGVVSNLLISKQDFVNKITSCCIPVLKKDESLWVRKITKFKGFIKCIQPYFNKNWFIAICNSAGMTDRDMNKYNSNNSADLEQKLRSILKQHGI